MPRADEFIGRKEEIQDLINLVFSKKSKIINVFGVLGIGKTEICCAVLDRVSRFANVVEIDAKNCTTYESFLASLANTFGIAKSSNTENVFKYRISLLSANRKTVLYIDNFEDTLSDSRVLALLLECKRICNELIILTSSRSTVPSSYNYPIDRMNEDDCIELFTSIWMKSNTITTIDYSVLREFIHTCLGYHTLTIVLVASHSGDFDSIDQLKRIWTYNHHALTGFPTTSSSSSLLTAIYTAYQRIRDFNLAAFVCEVFLIFPQEIRKIIADRIFGDQDIQMALKEVKNSGLIGKKNGVYYMLQPIRENIGGLIRFGERHNKYNGSCVTEYVLERYLECENKEEIYSDIVFSSVFLLENALLQENEIVLLNRLLVSVKELFRRYPSLTLNLFTAIAANYQNLTPRFYVLMGDILHIIGDNNKSLQYYSIALMTAERGHPRIRADILRKQSEIYRLFNDKHRALASNQAAMEISKRTSYYEGYIKSLWNESEVYRLIDRDIHMSQKVLFEAKEECQRLICTGISIMKYGDILWSIGENFVLLRRIRDAREHFMLARNEYEIHKNSLGLAYLYMSLARINRRHKESNSLELLQQSMAIFREMDYALGCGHVHYEIGKLIYTKHSDQTVMHYNAALEYYVKSGYIRGIERIHCELNRIINKDGRTK